MMQPKILVLLAAFNGSNWIIEQIQSILSQVGVHLDLVISDDGSTDETLASVERFAHDRRIRVVSPPNPTGSAAQNFLWLIRNTSVEGYDFVALADQDDIWHDEKLVRGCSTLASRDAAGYSCAVTAFWKDGSENVLRQVELPTRSDFLFEGAGQGCTFVLTGSFYIRLRQFLIHNSGQTELLHFHDWAIYALSRAWGLTWAFDQRPMIRYRQHGNNDTGARASIAGITKRLRLIKVGWYRRQLVTIAQICGAATVDNSVIAEWRRLLAMPRGIVRKARIVRFCLAGGRRRVLDNTILIVSALAGWI